MLRQKQIKNITVADLTALTASGLNVPEFAYVASLNQFYTRIAGVNTKIDPIVVDAIPTNGSLNPVSSDGTFDALATKVNISLYAVKGDILGAAGASSIGALAIGSANQVLTVDATSPVGFYWKTIQASNIFFTATGTVSSSNVQAAIAELDTEKQAITEKGVANGYAGLDATGKVPAGQLPSYVDDVLEYANLAAFPGTGETGKIYVAIDTGLIYRWSGTIYVNISAAPAIPVTSVFGRTGAVVATNGDYTATQITNTPAGNISAVTVQAAITELDNEKQADIQIINEGSNVGTAGQYTAMNFIGPGINVAQNGGTASQLDITVTKGFTDKYDKLTPTAVNTVPNMSAAPLNSAEVVFYVNGLLESAGISCNGSGVITVVPATLGYSIETTDTVQVIYTAA